MRTKRISLEQYGSPLYLPSFKEMIEKLVQKEAEIEWARKPKEFSLQERLNYSKEVGKNYLKWRSNKGIEYLI